MPFSRSFASVMDDLIEGCQIIDPDWHYLYLNDEVVKQARISREEMLGHSMLEIYPGIENTLMFQTLRECMASRQPSRMENEFHFPDGRIGWFDLRFYPVEQGVLVLSLDITEQKATRSRMQDIQDQLRQSQKLEAIGLFAGSIAHDFNNILTVQMGYCELLKETIEEIPELAEELAEDLMEVQACTERGAALTRQLLAISRKQNLSPETFNPNEVVENLFDLLKRLLGERIQL